MDCYPTKPLVEVGVGMAKCSNLRLRYGAYNNVLDVASKS